MTGGQVLLASPVLEALLSLKLPAGLCQALGRLSGAEEHLLGASTSSVF